MKKLVDIAVIIGGICFVLYGAWQIYPPLMWIGLGSTAISAVIYGKNWKSK